LSHDDFVHRADAVCTAYNDATKSTKRPRTYKEIVGYVHTTLPLYQAAIDKLGELKPPSADDGAVRSWLAADRRAGRAIRELGDAAERRDYSAVNVAYSKAELASGAAQRAAGGLGMSVCGRLTDQ
jgi:hypothetical protein